MTIFYCVFFLSFSFTFSFLRLCTVKDLLRHTHIISLSRNSHFPAPHQTHHTTRTDELFGTFHAAVTIQETNARSRCILSDTRSDHNPEGRVQCDRHRQVCQSVCRVIMTSSSLLVISSFDFNVVIIVVVLVDLFAPTLT